MKWRGVKERERRKWNPRKRREKSNWTRPERKTVKPEERGRNNEEEKTGREKRKNRQRGKWRQTAIKRQIVKRKRRTETWRTWSEDRKGKMVDQSKTGFHDLRQSSRKYVTAENHFAELKNSRLMDDVSTGCAHMTHHNTCCHTGWTKCRHGYFLWYLLEVYCPVISLLWLRWKCFCLATKSVLLFVLMENGTQSKAARKYEPAVHLLQR